MRNRKWLLCFLTVFYLLSCGENSLENRPHITGPSINMDVDDGNYCKDTLFKKGDVRRYGLYPNTINPKAVESILALAKKGLPIFFPKGYYPITLKIKGAENITFSFDDAVLAGGLQIIDEQGFSSTKIAIKGKLTLLDKLFIRESNNITFDTLVVWSDETKSLNKEKNRGISIYAGSAEIHFETLSIVNTGGTKKDLYKYTSAALQIHGWNNNPKNISINNVFIKNAGRTGAYITGDNIQISKMKIDGFGLGSNKNMAGLEDAKPGSEKEFAAFWLNKCTNCTIGSLEIDQREDYSGYSLKLGMGRQYQPSIIEKLILSGRASILPIKDDKLTNVLIKADSINEKID